MPSRCWRLGLAGSCVLVQKNIAAFLRDALYFLQPYNTNSSITTRLNGDDATLRDLRFGASGLPDV